MKKFGRIFSFALCLLLAFALAACGGGTKPAPDDGGNGGNNGGGEQPKFERKNDYGLPAIFDEEQGYFNSAASVFEENGVRYVYYMANETKNQAEASVFVRKAEKADGKWSYGERKKLLGKSASGWDSAEIGAPDVVKGVFGYNGESYSYLMAYQGTETAGKNYSIGFAVAKTPDGEWIKTGVQPAIAYDADVHGDFVGFAGPALINNDKAGNIKVFYTYADAFGSYPAFSDLDCSDLGAIPAFGFAIVSTDGMIDGGDTVIFGNGDFAMDSETGMLYAVRDVYPLSVGAPATATKVELCKIDAESIYKVEPGEWSSVKTITDMDTDVENDGDGNLGWERIYAAALVSDEYGYIDGASAIECIFTASATEQQNEAYAYTPSLHAFTVSL